MRHLGDPLSRRIARPLGWYLPRGGYSDKVLSYGPIAYWPLWETAGVTAADQVNSPAQDGTYTGVTLANAPGPDGINNAPLFDGANDFVDIYTIPFRDAFNGSEGTAMGWFKVFNAGIWTDGAVRYPYSVRADANNWVRPLYRTAVNNQLQYSYIAGGVNKAENIAGWSDITWVCSAITWSATADEVKAYADGAQQGVTQGGVGVWAGVLAAAGCVIGARSNVPHQPWHGWVSHVAFWDSALNSTQIADLATV
jgi:hypothetical protein